MTKSNSKTTTTANKRKHPTKANKNSKPALLKVFLWGYAPTGFTKQHLVAIIGRRLRGRLPCRHDHRWSRRRAAVVADDLVRADRICYRRILHSGLSA
jgi:hypothetical protein